MTKWNRNYWLFGLTISEKNDVNWSSTKYKIIISSTKYKIIISKLSNTKKKTKKKLKESILTLFKLSFGAVRRKQIAEKKELKNGEKNK